MKRWIRSSMSSVLDTWFVKSDDGVNNCCIRVKGYDKPMRGRSSMICLEQQNDHIYVMCKPNEDDYGVPGGGWDKNETPKEAAVRELHEEVKIDPKHVEELGLLIEYHEKVKDWVKEHVSDPDDWWYGYYSIIFVGQYNKPFEGHVEESDKEKGYSWRLLNDVIDEFPIEYINAIVTYCKKWWPHINIR